MKSVFAVLAALVVSSAASAQAPIERPEWRNGDSWTYSFKNGQEAYEYTREVTGRDGSNTATLSKREGREPRQGIFTPDLNLLRTIDGTTTRYWLVQFPTYNRQDLDVELLVAGWKRPP